jgi:hypothetical protein
MFRAPHNSTSGSSGLSAALCRAYGQPWPDTVTVATPHDGRHLYFRIPPGTAAASTISRWPGIDIRPPGYRTGGYLAGPGSVVDGAEYVIDRDVAAAPLPRWLASLLTSPAPVP